MGVSVSESLSLCMRLCICLFICILSSALEFADDGYINIQICEKKAYLLTLATTNELLVIDVKKYWKICSAGKLKERIIKGRKENKNKTNDYIIRYVTKY